MLVGHAIAMASPQGRFEEGAALLSGRICERVEPYGKHLFYRFEGDLLLHVHLGLYGKWTTGMGVPPDPRGALRLRLLRAEHWLDLRGPTACEIYTPADRQQVLDRLGPDPLHRAADPELAWARLRRSKAPVGQLLMDQTVLAGVGNVFRAEVLFRAGLSPFTAGRDVSRETWLALWEDLRTLMRAGVRANRIVTTVPHDRVRRSGTARVEDAHYVYRRAGLSCRRCGEEIRTQVMAGRNLFWCPGDQVKEAPPGGTPGR